MQTSILIFSSLFIFSLCLNQQYYKSCLSDVNNNDILSPSGCRKYDSQESYCCLLSYTNEKKEYDFFIIPPTTYKNNITNMNNTKNQLRYLSESQKLCYGLSQEGYDKINKVIEELKKESGVDELYIDCGNKHIKYYLYNIIILLFIIF